MTDETTGAQQPEPCEAKQRLDGQNELEDTIAPPVDVTPEPGPDPAKVAEAERMLALQAQAGSYFGVAPRTVLAFVPVAGLEGEGVLDVTVRVDTRSFEWNRTASLRVVRSTK
jgi:hypothetical protein